MLLFRERFHGFFYKVDAFQTILCIRMVVSKFFLANLVGFGVIIQSGFEVLLFSIHPTDIVVRSGGGGMLRSEDFLKYLRNFDKVLQGLAVVAFGIIHYSNIVV